jgi:hypothetical protein
MLTSTVSPTGHSQRHHEVPHSAQRAIKAHGNRNIAVITPLAYAHRPFAGYKAIWDEKRDFSPQGWRSPSAEGGERRAQGCACRRSVNRSEIVDMLARRGRAGGAGE